jgi:hypothetical protein
MKKNKIRFHLAKGEHYMHWQIKYVDGEVRYFNPEHYQLVLFGCTLRNQRKTAEKICYDGIHKTVCAWVDADEVVVSTLIDPDVTDAMDIFYNPRVLPHWHGAKQQDLDNLECNRIVTIDNKLFITN